jgi:hypothetical protein
VSNRTHAYISCCKTLKLRCLLASAVAQLTAAGKRKRSQAFAAAAGTESGLIWELKGECRAVGHRMGACRTNSQSLSHCQGVVVPYHCLRQLNGDSNCCYCALHLGAEG